jgi:predicted glutamine amidotransferase
MCRWLAYSGGEIPLSELIFNTRHSLIDQSLSARSSPQTTNGDGFGVGWYGKLDTPGLYKNTPPAWNDSNLYDLCVHTNSRLYLAHVRASTGTAVQHTNCHPFRFANWLFVHNGTVREFARVRRALLHELNEDWFRQCAGSTDSELMFLLALQFGLQEDAYTGLARMAGFIEKTGWEAGVEYPLQMTLGVADGKRLYSVRYSSERDSRTLFHSKELQAIEDQLTPRAKSLRQQIGDNARCVVSEPLSELVDFWEPIAESTFLTIEDGKVESREFQPLVD